MANKVKIVTKVKDSKLDEEIDNGQETKKEKEVVRSEVLKKTRPCGCCPVELAQLPAGQQYFESPDGHVIVGETGRGQVMDRRLNKGKGGWINPMRG